MKKLDLHLKLSDVESDDALNAAKLKRSRHSPCVKDFSKDDYAIHLSTQKNYETKVPFVSALFVSQKSKGESSKENGQ